MRPTSGSTSRLPSGPRRSKIRRRLARTPERELERGPRRRALPGPSPRGGCPGTNRTDLSRKDRSRPAGAPNGIERRAFEPRTPPPALGSPRTASPRRSGRDKARERQTRFCLTAKPGGTRSPIPDGGDPAGTALPDNWIAEHETVDSTLERRKPDERSRRRVRECGSATARNPVRDPRLRPRARDKTPEDARRAPQGATERARGKTLSSNSSRASSNWRV